MIKLSIIVPAYNAGKYIEDTLTSIYRENPSAIEVILVDDGSTDDTINIIESKFNHHINEQSLIIIKQENKGVSKARNLGLEQALGEYVTFVDADDLVMNGYIHEILTCIEEHGTDIIEFGCRRFIHEIDLERNPDIYTYSRFGFFYIDEVISDIFSESLFYAPLRVIKRSCLNGITFPENVKYCEDLIFLSRIYKRIKTTFHINKALYGYRVNFDGATKNVKSEYITDLIEFYSTLTPSNEKHINLLKANLLFVLYKLNEHKNNRFKPPNNIKKDRLRVIKSILLHRKISFKKKFIVIAPSAFFSIKKLLRVK